jgi:hypothetical protein
MHSLFTKAAIGVLAAPSLAATLVAGAGVAQASASSDPTRSFMYLTGASARSATSAQRLPDDWVRRGSGEFGTSDAQDLLEYRIDHGAVGAEVVQFKLEANLRCIWAKTLVMRDGGGSQWDISINPAAGKYSDSNALWAHQVHNGQVFDLWKAGFLGFPYKVLEFGDLGDLQPGDRVIFTWRRDSGGCGE